MVWWGALCPLINSHRRCIHIKKRTLIVIVLLIIAAICGFLYVREYNVEQSEIAEYKSIQAVYTTTEMMVAADMQPLPYQVIDFDSLLEINKDTIGWVSIPDSEINYPVVQTSTNTKYLNTSFTGESSKSGSVFMDTKNKANPLDKNTVIYAHHIIGRSDMFASLLEYKEKEYYDEHQRIQFDTVWEQHGWWRIFAVINLNVKKSNFNYLQLEFPSGEDFANWIESAKELSAYDTGVGVRPSDKILTLSTCDRSNYGKNGRQIVLAVWEGEAID